MRSKERQAAEIKTMKSEAAITERGHEQTPPPLWAFLVATFFGIGRMRPGPGTWGSLAAALIWLAFGTHLRGAVAAATLAILIVIAVALGIPAATQVARSSGKKDPQHVVIDEVAGQWLTMLFAPLSWKTMLAGFILFRGFDIFKPPPIRQLERLPEGTGIVVDDLGAGIYAFLVMQLLLHFGLLSQ